MGAKAFLMSIIKTYAVGAHLNRLGNIGFNEDLTKIILILIIIKYHHNSPKVIPKSLPVLMTKSVLHKMAVNQQ